jgi:long-chain acyl-CoA synthetase
MKMHWPRVTLAQAQAMLTAPGAFFETETVSIGGRQLRVWKRAPATLRDLFVRARGFGARECLVSGETRIRFEDFARATLAVAAELTAQGIKRGERVAIAMRNLPEWPAVFFGAVLAGAIATPLNAWWTGSELESGLNDSGARFAFVDAERLARLQARLSHCPGLERVYGCRGVETNPHTAVFRLEDIFGTPHDWCRLPARKTPEVPLAADDDAAIFYTSGTMAAPRGVVCSHRNFLSSILAMGYALARDIVRAGGPVPGGEFLNAPQRGVLLSIPLFHVTGACAVLGPSLFIGAKLVLMHKWDPEEASRTIERERITQVWGVPTTAQGLLAPALDRYDRSSLRLISYGGAPFPPELAGNIKRTFPRAYAGCGWGMTETAAICTSHSGEDYLRHPDSSGLAAPVCDLKVTNPDGRTELPCGEVGELWVRGPNVAKGYWRKPQETAAVFGNDWVRTGDLARLDAEGFCTIVDRAKDMLIRGGENIYCTEVENVLCEHPAVAEAAVVPIIHETLGEEPGAVVRLKQNEAATESDLIAFAGRRLAAFKVPVRIAFWPHALPRNAGGKLARGEMKNVFARTLEI